MIIKRMGDNLARTSTELTIPNELLGTAVAFVSVYHCQWQQKDKCSIDRFYRAHFEV